MSFSIESSTRLSFLAKLNNSPNELEVWEIFVEKYGRAIYQWCIVWGASVSDAEDIVQQTLLVVFRKVQEFQHGGKLSFRAWLRQIAKYTWMNVFGKASRTVLLPIEDVEHLISVKELKTSAARADLIHRFDELACEEIRDLAFARVRERVSEQTWAIFMLFEHEKLSGSEIAERFHIREGAVRLAAYRVRRMLNEEVVCIDPSMNDLI